MLGEVLIYSIDSDNISNILIIRSNSRNEPDFWGFTTLGYSNFSWAAAQEIIEYCDVADIVAREQFYIDSLAPAYNIRSDAGSSYIRL